MASVSETSEVIKWLLDGEPWVEYRTRLDLLSLLEDDPSVVNAKSRIINHPKFKELYADLSNWQGQIVNNHKNANLPLHKLTFIADIGLDISQQEVREIADLIMEHQDLNGVFQVIMNIPKHFGGTGENTWGWMLCDAPIILYSLKKIGAGNNLIDSGVRFLASLVKDNGWGCTVSQEMGKFRGPGKKDDPCPYATLQMLKLLSQIDDYKYSKECRISAEALLSLWENSLDSHPYLFYMGTDFRKLKAPTMWYDIVSVAEVLSQFDWLRGDLRLKEMIDIIRTKADSDGRFTPESEYKACKDWDFGQKKKPSRWLTFLILRILKRMEI